MNFARTIIASLSLSCVAFSAYAQNAAAPAAAPQAATPAISAPAATAPVTGATGDSRPVTRGELPALIKEALMNDPEMIIKAVQKMREKQMAESKKMAKDALQKHKAELLADTTNPSVGPADANVTIIEFFDYHCGYCKQLMPAVAQVLRDDAKVRFIFREFPILSEDSVTASRAALAVHRIAKDKYFAFHQALMKASGKFDEKSILEIAKKNGIDTAKLKAEMAKPEVTAALDKNREVASALNITGTPALIIGDEIIPGAISYDELRKMIENIRSGKTATATDEKAEAPAAEKPAPVAAPAAPVAAPVAPAEAPKQ